MKPIHVFAVALLFGSAAAFGVVAATRTAHVGAAAQPRTSNASIALRARRLNRVERQLRRALRVRPPALPAVPVVRPAPAAPPAASPPSAPPARVVYHRPAPIVVVKHRSGGDHEQEGGDGGD